MRIVFMGTPEYVIPPLQSLISVADVVGVYTQPDRPVGRGGVPTPPPVARYCIDNGVRLFQPASLRNPVAHQELSALEPDVVVVAAYGKLLPSEVLQIPHHGCLNIHPSLLPRYRGPSPVVGALLEGDKITGVTVMVVDEGMDSGPIVVQKTTEIGLEETADTLTARLFRVGGELLVSILPDWVAGDLRPIVQSESLATVTQKITKKDGLANWNLPAQRLAWMCRAYEPWPGLYTYRKGKILKLTKARAVPPITGYPHQPGAVLNTADNPVAIATGEGLLAVDELQLEGRRSVSAEEFLRGQRDFVGAVLPD